MSSSKEPQTRVPGGLLLASPVAYALSQWSRNREDDKKHYGGGTTKTYVLPSTGAVMLGVVVGVLLFCFFGIVPLGRAFNCGPFKTSLGYTGTSWGLLILILWLFFPPLGVLLGAVYLFGGKCVLPPIMAPVSAPIMSPMSPYASVPVSYTPTPVALPPPGGP